LQIGREPSATSPSARKTELWNAAENDDVHVTNNGDLAVKILEPKDVFPRHPRGGEVPNFRLENNPFPDPDFWAS